MEENKNGARALDGWKTNANEILTTPVTCYGPSWTKNRAHFFDLSFFPYFFLSPFCNTTVRKPHGYNRYTWRGDDEERVARIDAQNPVRFILHRVFELVEILVEKGIVNNTRIVSFLRRLFTSSPIKLVSIRERRPRNSEKKKKKRYKLLSRSNYTIKISKTGRTVCSSENHSLA